MNNSRKKKKKKKKARQGKFRAEKRGNRRKLLFNLHRHLRRIIRAHNFFLLCN